MAGDRATLKVEQRSEFGSRPSRRLRRSGLVPGVVYGEGTEARAFQVPERVARTVLTRGGALIDLEFDGSGTTPVVVKEQQRDPVRGSLIHLDLLEVKLDEEIEAEVPIELLGSEDAPGVKEGGVLEHVTHQITIEALPTAIPESIPADVSGMSIGDTLQLSALMAPEGVEFAVDDPDEVTIATLSPPRVEEEPEPELEEEAELVGEEGEVPEGEEAPEGEGPGGRGPGRGRRLRLRGLTRATLRPAPPGRGGRSRTRRFGGRPPRADRRPWQPRLDATRPPATTSASRWPPSSRGAGSCPGRRSAFAGGSPRAAPVPGGPQVAVLMPQTYMNESGASAGPARGALKLPLERWSCSTTRSTCRSGRCARSSAAGSPAITG